MYIEKYMKKKVFTLVELMLAMSIFAVLMLILMQIFGSTQDVWRKTGSKAESYESARIALNIIAEDLANAVYVEDYHGKSFHYYATKYYDSSEAKDGNSDYYDLFRGRLWFATKKPYTIDDGQKSLEVEVEYRLRANTSSENTDENVPTGLNLNKLEYYITTDSVVSISGVTTTLNGYDFRSNTNAHQTPASPNLRGILLDNVLSFSVIPLYITVSGGSSSPTSTPCGNFLPNMVMVSLTVLDNDNAVRNRYMNASTDEEKYQISRTFVRVIPIKRGQVYNTSNLNMPSSW